MSPFEKLLQLIAENYESFDPLILLKLLFLAGLGIYLAFALIIVRQVGLMTKTLNGMLDIPIRLVAWVHLGVAVMVFGLALLVL